MSNLLLVLAVTAAGISRAEPATPAATLPEAPSASAAVNVVVIPMRDQIAAPILYVLRRGLKEAIEQHADVVVLDMKTPGGALDVTLEIMEALDKFPGRTITYVNDEATSAGALIAAVTDDIYFSPRATMGSAEPVDGTGKDIDESMKRKVTAYMTAKLDAYIDTNPRRAEVIKAMMNPDFELKLDDTVIKAKGELLNVSARRAFTSYGEPPTPLLAAGIATDLTGVLTEKFGEGKFQVRHLEVTWSERLAQYLNAISPVLMGLGMLALFIEFKTPGFGFFGIAGGVLLAIVFLGNYVAGFSGHEPALVFALGALLVLIEVLFAPGVIILALSGVVLMLGSLLWSMADLWPNEPLTITGDVFTAPLLNLGLGLLIAVVAALALVRFLPRSWFWDKLVLQAAINTSAQTAGGAPAEMSTTGELVGRHGVAMTALFPSGQIEIDGERYEARVEVGSVQRGERVVVTGRSGFSLLVEAAS